MSAQIIYPDDFDDYAWEVEAKGWYAATVANGELVAEIEFTDPGRLAQDVALNIELHGHSFLEKVMVAPEVTAGTMNAAIAHIPEHAFLPPCTGRDA